MLAYVAILWIVGVVCLAAAVVGKAMKLGGAEIPAIPLPAGRVAFALIGLLALVLGLMLFVHESSASREPPGSAAGPETAPPDDPSSPAPTDPGPARSPDPPSSPAPTPVSPSPVAPDPTVPDPDAPDPDAPDPDPAPDPRRPDPDPPDPAPPAEPVERVWWQGTLVLDGDSGVTGWFLDPVPPARAPLGDLGLGCMLSCSANQLVGNTIVVWDGSAPPRLQQCADLLGTRLGQRYVDVRTGDMACFMTEGRRVGYVTVASMSGPARMNLEVTVWRQP